MLPAQEITTRKAVEARLAHVLQYDLLAPQLYVLLPQWDSSRGPVAGGILYHSQQEEEHQHCQRSNHAIMPGSDGQRLLCYIPDQLAWHCFLAFYRGVGVLASLEVSSKLWVKPTL